ncbi:hypothetical protein HZB74_00850 [Candidatus Saccharibacteria bacterium]|nr:hypothetical protein [Candidatus Saccharibacteria bacterium]
MYADPLELAKAELGDQFNPIDCGPVTEDDQRLKERLHENATSHGFMDERYWVETAQGIVMPAEYPSMTEGLEVRLVDLHNIAFAGYLSGFYKFSIGQEIGSWCLYFDKSVLAPNMEEISEEDELWVPTFSVKKIEPL